MGNKQEQVVVAREVLAEMLELVQPQPITAEYQAMVEMASV
jgi:hypothetical protein